MELTDRIATGVRTFLDTLDADQSGPAVQPFDGEARRTWAYWPTERIGVPLWSLDRAQAKAAHRLLASLLGLPAYARAVTIMNLDEVLDRIDGYRDNRRHGGDYWVTVFGRPGGDAWGVRFEGHHVSIHATVVGRHVRLTPLFLGANPAVVADGGRPAIAPLGLEEELGFELLDRLSPDQRAAAVISDVAPADLISRNQPCVDRRLVGGSAGDGQSPPGVRLDGLTGSAASAAEDLLAVYLGRFPDGSHRPDLRDATFSWAGSPQVGAGHYYRISGPRLLIELDNTQNGANHVHTVVRDPGADFGDDLLAAHYQQDH